MNGRNKHFFRSSLFPFFRIKHLLDIVEWTMLHLTVNLADVDSDDSNGYHHDASNKPDGED